MTARSRAMALLLLACAFSARSNGTFTNPILSGFHPDPSICRAGGDFYLVNSTFEYFPGLPIYHSKDLVNWRQIGNALDRPSQLPLKGATDGGGLYAPTIRYWKGTFYLACTNISNGGAFIVTATDPAGPWSEPKWLKDSEMDGSLFFDDDGKAYYTKHAGGERAGIAQAEIDAKEGKLLAPFKVIYNDPGEQWNEGPHLYKIRGLYYLMLAEGGTGDMHQEVIGRSSSPWGPFEHCPHNPILTHRGFKESPIQCTGHADLVEAPDGSWWAVFLGVRPHAGVSVLGRETFLAPVHWDEKGWPMVGDKGRVAISMPAPELKSHPFPQPGPRWNFDKAVLGPEWIHPRNPEPADFNLKARKGWLRIRASKASLSDKFASPAFVGQRQGAFRQEASVKMEFLPRQSGEEAGLCVRSNDANHYELGVELGKVFVRNTVKGETSTVAEAPFAGGAVYLKIAADEARYAFAWSKDGAAWNLLAHSPAADLSKERAGGFTGTAIGAYASSNGQASAAYADFDYFETAPGQALEERAFAPRPTPTPLPPSETWRIHAGGPGLVDSQGRAWIADQGFEGGETVHMGAEIEGTADPELYRAERWGREFAYALSVPPGKYRVTLRFAENYVTKPGGRIFNVAINGKKVLSKFDILKAAGKMNKALDRGFKGIKPGPDGRIRIQFTSEVQNAKVSGIEVRKE